MKQQAKLYKEYLKWVNEQNIEYKKEWDICIKESLDRRKKAEAKYQKQLDLYEQKRARAYKEQEEFDKKNFIYKYFNESPLFKFFNQFDTPDDDEVPRLDINHFFIPPVRESTEGFYRWLVEVKYT